MLIRRERLSTKTNFNGLLIREKVLIGKRALNQIIKVSAHLLRSNQSKGFLSMMKQDFFLVKKTEKERFFKIL